MMKPLVHLNGTSRCELSEQYREAMDKTWAAVKAVQDASPNARDYYVLGPDAYRQAREEHETRLKQLHAIGTDMETLFLAVEG